MNKYQENIFNEFDDHDNFIFSHCCPSNSENDNNSTVYGVFDKTTDSFNITQDEDITKTQYALIIEAKKMDTNPLGGVFIQKNDQWIEIPFLDNQYKIIADFDDRIDAIKFSFVNEIADDYILKITYTPADKEKYYAKLAQERKAELLATASIKVSTGADLVNIYFQPCCEEYDHSEIELFVSNEYAKVGGSYGSAEKKSNWSFIGKYNVPTDNFFKSINGLAYEKFAFILKQFDKNNGLLLETDYITFSINEPTTPTFGRINGI